MESMGYAHLVNMAGGMHDATDMSGNVIEPGWLACGLETSLAATPARTWEELSKA